MDKIINIEVNMSKLKENIPAFVEKCLKVGKLIDQQRTPNKRSYPGYSEICFISEREDDFLTLPYMLEQLELMIKEDDGKEKGLAEDLTKMKDIVSVISAKMEERSLYIEKLKEEKQKEIDKEIEILNAEINSYSNVEKLTIFRINMNAMDEELKLKSVECLEELGFYFVRESFDFSVFIGELENNKKIQNVKNHLIRKIDILKPFKSGTSAVRVKNIEDFIYWLR